GARRGQASIAHPELRGPRCRGRSGWPGWPWHGAGAASSWLSWSWPSWRWLLPSVPSPRPLSRHRSLAQGWSIKPEELPGVGIDAGELIGRGGAIGTVEVIQQGHQAQFDESLLSRDL